MTFKPKVLCEERGADDSTIAGDGVYRYCDVVTRRGVLPRQRNPALSGLRKLARAAQWLGGRQVHSLNSLALHGKPNQRAVPGSDRIHRNRQGVDPSLDGLAERIRERTGGNPFFIEEVVQAPAEGEAMGG
jgi:hypothetical protein